MPLCVTTGPVSALFMGLILARFWYIAVYFQCDNATNIITINIQKRNRHQEILPISPVLNLGVNNAPKYTTCEPGCLDRFSYIRSCCLYSIFTSLKPIVPTTYSEVRCSLSTHSTARFRGMSSIIRSAGPQRWYGRTGEMYITITS